MQASAKKSFEKIITFHFPFLIYICLLLFVFFTYPVFGQKNEQEDLFKSLKFKNISLNEGLSQSSVLCILQDKKGFLWFGTRDGLNKYDGKKFRKFSYDSQDSSSISHSFIKTIFEDRDGSIWVGTANGLNKYIPESNSFKKYYFRKNKSNSEIWSIAQVDKNHLWIGTNSGIKQINTKDGSINELNINEKLFLSPTRALLVAQNNIIWIKTTENVGSYNIKSKLIQYFKNPEITLTEKFSSNPSELFEDKSRNIWLGSKDGLSIYNESLGIFEAFKINGITEIKDAVRKIIEDYSGKLWIGTYDGLFVINKEKTQFSRIIHDENDPNSISQNSIYSIIEDSRKDIWIGTYAGGINYYDRSFNPFKSFAAGTNNSRLDYKVVSSFVEDDAKNLWIGTEGGGLNFYNSQTGKFSYYSKNQSNPNSLSSNNVKSLIKDHAGNLWIGTHDGGLNFLNPKQSPFIFKKYLINSDNKQGLSNNRVISLLEDSNYNIWIGTSGGGLNIFNTGSKSFMLIKDSLQIVGGIIYSISKYYHPNELLIGGENGLAKINIDTKKWTLLNYNGQNKINPITRAVLCTFIDKDYNIWIGTEGDGLYCYNEKSNKFTKYGVSQGLPNDVVYGILPDNNGNIWLSTNFGLSRLNLRTRQFKNFSESDGLQSNEFNYGAYLKNSKGELLFGGTNGFNRFNPNEIKENKFIPPIAITELTVNNKPFLILSELTKSIDLKHNQNDFNFDFVALNFSQPDKNLYAYKLENFDSNWNYVGNKTSATYTNINEGKYTFKVKASNSDGLWNEKEVSIELNILPAPWKTWWAYLIYLALIAAFIYYAWKYSLQRIRERNELKQERLEKEQIEEVNKLKLQLFTNISHDFRTPLTLIMGPLEQLIKVKEDDKGKQELHSTMYRNAKVLMELINQLLDFRKSESGKLKVLASNYDLVAFSEEIKLAFDQLARDKEIAFTLSSSQSIVNVWFDKIMIKKVLYNLLSNAFKFTPKNGKIEIKIEVFSDSKKGKDGGFVNLVVSDSGEGIPEENIGYVFDRYYQFGKHFGTGIGLTLAKSLVELHKGTLNVISSVTEGTSFTVKLPLGHGHFTQDQLQEPNGEPESNGLYGVDDIAVEDEKVLEVNKVNKFEKVLPAILIVEDNVEIRNFLKGLLQTEYNVFEANNGEVGLELARSLDVDLIISDVIMPKMDGIEMCKEIKTNIRTSHIPVVLLTARSSEEFQNTGYKTGADAYITKPFDAEVLKVRVRNLIESRKKLIEKFKKDIILQPKEVTATTADEEFLQKAIDIVEQNMTNPDFEITDFIDEIGMSRSVFYKKLKALTDQSISEFIRTLKLKRAAQLLKHSELNVSEIAFELGFNDLKYFRETFKLLFKVTPSEYRNTDII